MGNSEILFSKLKTLNNILIVNYLCQISEEASVYGWKERKMNSFNIVHSFSQLLAIGLITLTGMVMNQLISHYRDFMVKKLHTYVCEWITDGDAFSKVRIVLYLEFYRAQVRIYLYMFGSGNYMHKRELGQKHT